MKKLGIVLIVAILPLSFAYAVQKPKTIEFEGSTYTRLEGENLSSVLIESAIFRYGHIIEKFYRDGTYRSHGELVPGYGKYKIFNTRFCIDKNAANQTKFKSCREIYTNLNRRYISINLSSGSKLPYAINIETNYQSHYFP